MLTEQILLNPQSSLLTFCNLYIGRRPRWIW